MLDVAVFDAGGVTCSGTPSLVAAWWTFGVDDGGMYACRLDSGTPFCD